MARQLVAHVPKEQKGDIIISTFSLLKNPFALRALAKLASVTLERRAFPIAVQPKTAEIPRTIYIIYVYDRGRTSLSTHY